jgi:cbb3-type cytochrome oxidase subunit 3
MFKELFKLDPNSYDFIALLANGGMVIFFLVFVSVSLYALTRRKKDVDRWSRIAIEDDVEGSGVGIQGSGTET